MPLRILVLVLFVILASIATLIIDAVLFPGNEIGPINVLTNLVLFLPGIAVFVRRLHDVGRSGWFYFLMLVPIVGWIILFVWSVTKGDDTTNRFGADPLAPLAA